MVRKLMASLMMIASAGALHAFPTGQRLMYPWSTNLYDLRICEEFSFMTAEDLFDIYAPNLVLVEEISYGKHNKDGSLNSARKSTLAIIKNSNEFMEAVREYQGCFPALTKLEKERQDAFHTYINGQKSADERAQAKQRYDHYSAAVKVVMDGMSEATSKMKAICDQIIQQREAASSKENKG